MRTLRLSWALITIPRLFISLLAWPLLLGLMIVIAQAVITQFIISSAQQRSTAAMESKITRSADYNVGRVILFGDGKARPEPLICRWAAISGSEASATTIAGAADQKMITAVLEGPRSVECQPDRLDVALHVVDPDNFNPTPYLKIFRGNIDRLHLCRSCRPDVIIDTTRPVTETRILSVWGLLILHLVRFQEDSSAQLLEVLRGYDQVIDKFGTLLLLVPGFEDPIPIAKLAPITAVILNIAGLIVITLWLGLRAHRRVLDYFARSGALLPMVAACGQRAFYGALWLLTGIRVGAFVFAAVPLTIYGVGGVLKDDFSLESGFGSPMRMTLWLLALGSGLTLAALIGSISELKDRHSSVAFVYRFIPFVICLLGGIIWASSFLLPDATAQLTRVIITGIPLLGTIPIIIAPIFKPQIFALTLHSILTIVAIFALSRRNIRWFAAHLEEI